MCVARGIRRCPSKVQIPVASCCRNQWRDLSLRHNRGDKTPLELFLFGIGAWSKALVQSAMELTVRSTTLVHDEPRHVDLSEIFGCHSRLATSILINSGRYDGVQFLATCSSL